MLRQFRNVGVAAELRVRFSNRDYLEVLLPGVQHRHPANYLAPHKGERHNRLLAEDQNVERVIILSKRLGNETVVGGVENSRIQHSIQLDEPGLLIQFVLDVGTRWDLDYRIEVLRGTRSGVDVVPWMKHLLRVLFQFGLRTQQLFIGRMSSPFPVSPPLSVACASSSGISFSPRSGSRVSVIDAAHRPQSQNWAVCRSGFSSNGSVVSSLAATEIDTTSNWNNRPSANEWSGV